MMITSPFTSGSVAQMSSINCSEISVSVCIASKASYGIVKIEQAYDNVASPLRGLGMAAIQRAQYRVSIGMHLEPLSIFIDKYKRPNSGRETLSGQVIGVLKRRNGMERNGGQMK